MGQTTDKLLSRRKNWDGVVVKGIAGDRSLPDYGHYSRVRGSWRDPDTGQWQISADYIGAEAPRGEKIYIYDGTTWDMPLAWGDAFPWMIAIFTTTLFIFAWPIAAVAFVEEGPVAPIMIQGYCVFQLLFSWFYRREPVRGTKVEGAIVVAAEANIARNASQGRY